MRHVPRRHYAEPEPEPGRRRLKDIDSAERAYKIRAAWYAGAGGVIGGVVAGTLRLPFLLGFAVGWAIAYGITIGLMKGAGRAASLVYAPKGTSTPQVREYSDAQALASQGLFGDATRLYEAYAAEFPEDPTPYIAAARILRDHLGDPEGAAGWFRRARRDAKLSPGLELLVTQELIELYTSRLGQPRRAIPELARIPHLVPGTPQAEAAERDLARLRAELLDRDDDGAAPG